MFQNIFITNRTEDSPATVYIWDDAKGLITYPFADFDYAYKLDRNGTKETIFGDKVSKVFRWNEGARNIFESDVPRETRVLTDLYLDTDDVAKGHRVLNFDIEVAKVGDRFANIEKADGKITAIGCHAQARDEYVVFLLDEDGRFQPRQQQTGNESVLAFDTEEELIQAFLAYYRDYEPTILTGWNICGFDTPYLYRRIAVLFDDETAKMLSPIGIIRYSRAREMYQIAGVSQLDYFLMYQKFTFARRPSYRLHDIGMYEVNMGKVEYEGSLDDFYKNDLKGFIEYNLQDVRIVAALDKKLKMIDLAVNISAIGHTPLEDYSYSSKYIEGTILTYLHRQGRVVPNKRAEGRAEFEERLENGEEEGFTGAFVKPPMPGLYEWVYNLDLQSLYPSIIMSLNISPETKIGYVRNWNLEEHMKGDCDQYIVEIGSVQNVVTREQFISFMNDEGFMISSNGVLYRSDKLGVIPEILDVWFNQRVEFKGLMKKFKKEGNDEQADYYDRRQHVQKILLNSIYGVLGLPIFRFYDLDNALAVTATGQDVIKASAKCLSQQYVKRGVAPKTTDFTAKYKEVLKKELKKPNNKLTKKDVAELLKTDDHCIYIDTDSVYFTASPLIPDGVDAKEFTIELAREMEGLLNRFYNPMAKKFFFCDKHRFVIKGEAVCETAFWVAKKRYAMKKVYDLESNMPFEKPKLGIKGLDVVRSSFPPAFAKFMSECLTVILDKTEKSVLDDMILKFRKDMNGMPFKMVARNTSVSSVKKVDDKKERGFKNFPSGASAHVKAAIAYNRWLRVNKLDKMHVTINDGDKIKYTYLKKNPLGIEAMALKGYDDPEELVKFVDQYMDYDALFEKELKNKLDDFYEAREWGMLPTDVNQEVTKFFSF